MKTVVMDASVLIDLASFGLLEQWFTLGLDTVTTSLVWREVNRKYQKARLQRFAESGDVRIEPIGADVLTNIVLLQAEVSSKISFEDASVLHLASSRQAILLVGDKVLRHCAEDHGIEVHGLLWVMDLLVSRGRLLPRVAADRLEHLVSRGTTRLPEREIVGNASTNGATSRIQLTNAGHTTGAACAPPPGVKGGITRKRG